MYCLYLLRLKPQTKHAYMRHMNETRARVLYSIMQILFYRISWSNNIAITPTHSAHIHQLWQLEKEQSQPIVVCVLAIWRPILLEPNPSRSHSNSSLTAPPRRVHCIFNAQKSPTRRSPRNSISNRICLLACMHMHKYV